MTTTEQKTKRETEKLIRQISSEGRVEFSFPHCFDEMDEDGLTPDDVLRVLRTGKLMSSETRNGETRHRMNGTICDLNTKATAIVRIGQDERGLLVITVFLATR